MTLESVQMPALKTVGKNLFNDYNEFIKVNHSEKLYLSSSDTTGATRILLTAYDENKNLITSKNAISSNSAFYHREIDNKWMLSSNKSQLNAQLTLSDDVKYIVFETLNGLYMEYENIQLEEGSIATSYEPYKSNILTVNEDVVLRGIGDVQDELDLINGGLTQRIKEVVLNGETISNGYTSTDSYIGEYARHLSHLVDGKNEKLYFQGFVGNLGNSKDYILTNGFAQYKGFRPDDSELEEGLYRYSGADHAYICISASRFTEHTFEGVKKFLKENPQSYLVTNKGSTVKTVALNSTYYFQPVLNRSVEVNGTVLPLVYSVTVPTDPLSFVLNPNAEEGQRFIAPTFTITNDTPASIQIELKAFEQTTDTFNDVLPTKYQNWNQLSKDQSKDFALALLPVPSEGWASLKEGPRYVADSSNYDLGEIKAESSVDFTFTASRGRAFVERLNPQYRLSFMFGF